MLMDVIFYTDNNRGTYEKNGGVGSPWILCLLLNLSSLSSAGRGFGLHQLSGSIEAEYLTTAIKTCFSLLIFVS
jgi:hypothetical protein